MKNFLFITIFTTCGLMLSAQTFVSTTQADKNIVIEQFSEEDIGISLTDSIINNLIVRNQGRVFGMTIHDYNIIKTTYDFTCKEGLAFVDYFKPWDYSASLGSFPLVMVNRGNMEDMQNWENRVNTILSQPSCLNVAAQGSIDWNLRQLMLTVEVYYTDNSNTAENYLTVALLQNNLQNKEMSFLSDAELPNQKHNHLRVLRAIISEQWGDTIVATTQGSFYTKTYTYNIPDTIESTIPNFYKELSIRPEVFLEDLEVIVFVSESKTTIISGDKAEINHVNLPEINLHATLDNIHEYSIKCGEEFPIYLMLKNGGSDTIHSIEYDLLKDNQPLQQNQVWNSRLIYPFTMDSVAINNIPMVGGVESLIAVEITKVNGKDTLIRIEKSFTRSFVEDARGAMTFVIAHDQFGSGTYFRINNSNGETVITNRYDNWQYLSSPGIVEYSYDFFPETIGCYNLWITSNLNKGYGEGYFKLLASDGTVLLYNDGTNCKDLYTFINVTEPVGIHNIHNESIISVFPNPTSNQLRITNYELRENTEIQIFDIVGQSVGVYPCGRPEMAIDVSHLASGLYFLKIDGKVVKFVKK